MRFWDVERCECSVNVPFSMASLAKSRIYKLNNVVDKIYILRYFFMVVILKRLDLLFDKAYLVNHSHNERAMTL